jgi:hypothetical protein
VRVLDHAVGGRPEQPVTDEVPSVTEDDQVETAFLGDA